MRELATRNIISVWVEGGGGLSAGILAACLAHKVIFFVAPKIAGGQDAPTPIEGGGVARMADAVALDRLRVRRFGTDIALSGYIKRE